MTTFYHISRDCSDKTIETYIKEGIAPSKGIGYGGQKSGFYCWTSNEDADRYYKSLLAETDAQWAKDNFGIDITLKEGKALKLAINCHNKDIKYPLWQLDNEQHPKAKAGRKRSVFLDFWSANKNLFQDKTCNFEFTDANNHKMVVTELHWNETKNCPEITYANEQGKIVKEIIDNTNAINSGRTQAINDYMCNTYSQYTENYNKLISAAIHNQESVIINNEELFTRRLAIKYCGNEPIKNIDISIMKGEITVAPDKGINSPCDGDIPYGDYRLKYQETTIYSFAKEKIKNDRKKIHSRNNISDNTQTISDNKPLGPLNLQKIMSKQNNNY